MFICKDCGSIFEEPGTHKEYHPYGDTYAAETWSCCPSCGCNDIEEAEQCAECGEYYAYSDSYRDICDDCHKDIQKRIAKALCKEFGKDTLDRLPDDIFDGVWDYIEKECQ